MKNFHLPLPEQTYIRLRAEAERTHVPSQDSNPIKDSS